MMSLPRLYLGALLASGKRFDRQTRFERWQSGPFRIRLDRAPYERYAHCIGQQDFDAPLPGWYYVLAQRASIATLIDKRFPFPLVGMVHLGNQVRVERVPAWDSELTLRMEVSYGALTSAGHRIDVEALFYDGEDVVVRNVMSAMARCPDPQRTKDRTPVTPSNLPQSLDLPFAANAGRRYARVCDDYNPIHLWPWSARLFGFRRPIAHGMYGAGRIAALLTAGTEQPLNALEVTFLKPVFLPSVARLNFDRDDRQTAFELLDSDGKLLMPGVLG